MGCDTVLMLMECDGVSIIVMLILCDFSASLLIVEMFNSGLNYGKTKH